MLDDLLELSRLQSDTIDEAESMRVNMSAMLMQLKEQAEEISRGQHELVFDIDPKLHLKGVAADLESAIGNLIDRIVYGCLEGLGGSVSAEHGIGIEKKRWLSQTRSAAEIDMMRSLKRLLDPKNLLNPGKVVD